MLKHGEINSIVDNYEQIKKEAPRVRQSFLKRQFVDVFPNAFALFLKENLENRSIDVFIKNYIMKMIANNIISYHYNYLTMLSVDLDCQQIFNKIVSYCKPKYLKDIIKLNDNKSMYISIALILLEELLTKWLKIDYLGSKSEWDEEYIKELTDFYESIKSEEMGQTSQN